MYLSIWPHWIWNLHYGMWDLVPWPGIEPRPPAWGARSLSHRITREVPTQAFYYEKFWIHQSCKNFIADTHVYTACILPLILPFCCICFIPYLPISSSFYPSINPFCFSDAFQSKLQTSVHYDLNTSAYISLEFNICLQFSFAVEFMYGEVYAS